jgi:histone H3/H4
LQKTTNLLIFKLSFQRLVKKLMQHVNLKKNIECDLKIQRAIIDAFQEVVEEFLMKSFQSMNLLILKCFVILIALMINLFAIYVKRVIIQVKNMKLLNNLRFSMIDKNNSNLIHFSIIR